MTTQRFALAALFIALAAALSGCSGARRSASFSSSPSSGAPFTADPRCGRGNACMYDGHYDPGERDYAEREARRLNQAEYERLRSSFK
ncbi:MAG: hypothetical protein ACTHJ1_02470 [Bordetella sp.]|uniref:hypothetical protein n=1 Tax=Bordetella sp. TaxID=28081 RepID=UPI003F7C922A